MNQLNGHREKEKENLGWELFIVVYLRMIMENSISNIYLVPRYDKTMNTLDVEIKSKFIFCSLLIEQYFNILLKALLNLLQLCSFT